MAKKMRFSGFLCMLLISMSGFAGSDDLWIKIGESVDGETTHYIDTTSVQPSGANTFAWIRIDYSSPQRDGLFSKSYISESRFIAVNCSNDTMATTQDVRYSKERAVIEQRKWPESKWEFYSTGPLGSLARTEADVICSMGFLASPRVNLNVFGDWTDLNGSSYLVDKSDTRFISKDYFTARVKNIYVADKPWFGKFYRQAVEYLIGNCEMGTVGTYALGLFSARGEKIDTKIYPLRTVKMQASYAELMGAMCTAHSPGAKNEINEEDPAKIIERFSNDKINYPYFEQVRSTMADLIEQGRAETLDQAYQLAVSIHQGSSGSDNQNSGVPAYSYGSGFYVSKSGDILTNEHVVRSCRLLSVINPDRSVHRAVKVAADASNDLALIRAETREAPSLLPFKPSQSPLGEEVVVIGFPLPGVLSTDSIVTFGHINATSGIYQDTTRYQMSASVQPGNSGGPLLDGFGNIIGVTTEKLDAVEIAKQFGDLPQNVNFAIKSNIALVFLESYGIRPMISSMNSTRDLASATKRGRGITVQIVCTE
jgi:S1-C subfamily serine protease